MKLFNQKGFAPVLIIIAVLFISGIVYFAINRTETNQNGTIWQEYKSDNGRYSFKYPSDFDLKKDIHSDCMDMKKGDIRMGIGIRNNEATTSCFPSGFGRSINPEVLSTYTLNINGQSLNVTDVKYTVDAYPESKDEVRGPNNDKTIGTFVELDGNFEFEIYFSVPASQYSQNKELIHKILSSVKFDEK